MFYLLYTKYINFVLFSKMKMQLKYKFLLERFLSIFFIKNIFSSYKLNNTLFFTEIQ